MRTLKGADTKSKSGALSSIRIIAGKFKGRRLQTLNGPRTRPTSARVREALFSILGDMVPGSRVLDLFAGSGALGLEALSRGAEKVVFVEKDRDARGIIRENITTLAVEAFCEVIPGDYRNVLKRLGNKHDSFDLILSDPPYQETDGGAAENLLSLFGEFDTLRKNGLVVIEHSRRIEINIPDSSWKIFQIKRYGRSCLTMVDREWVSSVCSIESGRGAKKLTPSTELRTTQRQKLPATGNC